MALMRKLEYYKVVRPLRGERVGGDAAIVHELDDGLFIAIIDVLGHGPEAHEVAVVAEKFLAAHHSPNVVRTMERLHDELRGTRGAAAGICHVDSEAGQVRYVGVGNTAARKVARAPVRLFSRDGIVGDRAHTLKEQSLQLAQGEVLLLYTDGVSDRFDLEDYPGILRDDLRTVATGVVRRFGKKHDDAACIAARFAP
jgi:negative regulator of sigma-B (phosphoserine phosphatase)